MTTNKPTDVSREAPQELTQEQRESIKLFRENLRTLCHHYHVKAFVLSTLFDFNDGVMTVVEGHRGDVLRVAMKQAESVVDILIPDTETTETETVGAEPVSKHLH